MEDKLSENELLERVFMRLGSASTDERLEEFTMKFLTPVLLKLSSPDEEIKKKVLELLAQLNRLLKSRDCVQLPMEALLLQYQDPKCTVYVRNFTILYLKMAFIRLSREKQLGYLPQLFLSMKGKPKPQQDCLLQLAIPVFAMFTDQSYASFVKEVYSAVMKQKNVLDLFLGFVLRLLLLPYNAFSHTSSDIHQMTIPPGMSRAALLQVLQSGIDKDNLENVKLGLLKFLSADMLQSANVQVHFVVATSDSRHAVSGFADHQLKRLTEASDWEHSGVISKLMSIFLGSINLPGKPAIPTDEVCTAASVSLKLKIFSILLKSKKSANIFPSCLQIVFHSQPAEGSGQGMQKLKKFSIQFIHHICECSSDKVMAIVSPILLSHLVKLRGKQDGGDLERLTFLAIGKISKRSPALFHKDIEVFQSLFEALGHTEKETSLDILQALNMIANSCKNATADTLSLIEALLLNNVKQGNSMCQLAALQVGNIVFPSNHVSSRYGCLLLSAHERHDIREEAKKGLSLHKFDGNDGNNNCLPDFCQMISFVHQSISSPFGFKQNHITVAGTLPFSPAVYISILQYLHRCLKSSAGVTQEDEDNELTLLKTSKFLTKMLDSQSSYIHQYLSLLLEALKPAGTYDLHAVALVNILELVSMGTGQLTDQLTHEGTSWVKNFVWSSNNLIMKTSSHIFAILTCLSGKKRVLQELTQARANLNDPSEAVQQSSIVCCGYLIGQYLGQLAQRMEIEDVEDSDSFSSTFEKAISETFLEIAGGLCSPSNILLHAACDAVGEVCKQSKIPLPDGSFCVIEKQAEEDSEEKSLEPRNQIVTKADVVQRLAYIMSTSKETKLCEKAALVLGWTCVGETPFPHEKKVIQKLFESSKKRDIDFQFTVGEALSCAGAGRLSTALRSKLLAGDGVEEEHPETKHTMRWLLEKILGEYIRSDVAHVRKAACIWLLVLLKHSSKHSVVQEMMAGIQEAFFLLLSENDEIVQEVSSKGLSLVYEFGSESFREEIVSSLVESMLFSTRKVQNVTADTKLFDKAMPLGDSGQLSTYKELCSLASDMNQPELVYRFMHLANHNAMWNSKKGAAFGFASIATQAKKELEPHLKTLVPKLYRYQFDPNGKVREAMSSIWNAIVKDQRKVIDEYSQEIVAELLANLHNPAWRVRQSCCVAVGNFLNGRSMDSLVGYLPQLWAMCLRDMDDIKESVRKAAEVACKTLQSVSVRLCDVAQGKLGQETIRLLLPVLLEQGLASRVDDIRSLVLQTIVKISKNAGSLLRPHIPTLVATLLESLSGLEPQTLNYVSFHIHNDPNLQEQFEDARISFSKSSSMMETITLCIQYVDVAVLVELVPRLADLTRRGLGVGTKAGCASVVVSLVRQCGHDLQAHAGKLLSALLSGLSDRSLSVCKKYAEAIGHLVRVAKDTSVSKLFGKMKSWYLEKDSDSLQNACGLVCKEIARSSPDVLAHHAAAILPVAFVAMHCKVQSTGQKSPWVEIWSENNPVTSRGIQLYLEEIVTISSALLAGQSWQRKVEAAESLKTVVTTLERQLPKKYLDVVVNVLVSSLSGRTWDGKESLLFCLTSVIVKCGLVMEDAAIKEITTAVLRECRKEKRSYKANAIKCLGEILKARKVLEFQEIYDVLKPIVSPEKKRSVDDSEDEESPDSSLLIVAFECIGHAWPSENELREKYCDEILSVLTLALKKHPWKVQLAILESLNCFVRNLPRNGKPEFYDKLTTDVLTEIFPCLGNVKYAAIRLRSLDVASGLVSVLQDESLGRSESLRDTLQDLRRILIVLRNDGNENVKAKSAELEGLVTKTLKKYDEENQEN